MKIKTVFLLSVGIGIGFVLGMDVDEKTKERISLAAKRKIFRILTGTEMPETKKTNDFHGYTYKDGCFYRQKEEQDHD